MSSLLRHLGVLSLLLVFLLDVCGAQATGEECLENFKKGKDDFVLDADDSVKDGATFLSSPPLTSTKDCVAACCKEPMCNVAFMENAAGDEGLVKSCFLFDCLYKKKYVCKFVRKKEYINYILDTVYDRYVQLETLPNDSDQPPTANGGLDQVVQPQEIVTLNGVESKDDLGIASYKWSLLSPYAYAIIETTNFKDQIIVSNLTSGVYKFKLTVTDTGGQVDSTQVTVLVLTSEQSEHHCMAPKKVGPCRGAFPRWHYNAASEQCEKFTFGGCRENSNNYLTKDECTKACYGTEKLEKNGRGLPLTPAQEKCGQTCAPDQFMCENGCCIVKGLDCDGSPQCSDGSDENGCDNWNKKFRTLLEIPLDEKKVRCTEQPKTGNCRDTITRWYYYPQEQRCLRFNYGGCGGNENNFVSEEQCMKMCRGVTEKDVFERTESYEPSIADGQKGIIAIAAALGVGIFILLCILVYCLVRGKKKNKQHHRVPVNTIPVTSMEDRDHLVYNSTTKPI
uniref:Serine peptidase inhibitor, Kunitz type 1 a n=1 Tax=Neogobius melanostomus TaxID=47308 RepID=A0A8C6UKG3_9GOBI